MSSDDGYIGMFVIEKVIDDASCEARLNVFSPLGDSASTSFFFGGPDNFVLEDQGEVLKGRWMADISGNVVFTRQ